MFIYLISWRLRCGSFFFLLLRSKHTSYGINSSKSWCNEAWYFSQTKTMFAASSLPRAQNEKQYMRFCTNLGNAIPTEKRPWACNGSPRKKRKRNRFHWKRRLWGKHFYILPHKSFILLWKASPYRTKLVSLFDSQVAYFDCVSKGCFLEQLLPSFVAFMSKFPFLAAGAKSPPPTSVIMTLKGHVRTCENMVELKKEETSVFNGILADLADCILNTFLATASLLAKNDAIRDHNVLELFVECFLHCPMSHAPLGLKLCQLMWGCNQDSKLAESYVYRLCKSTAASAASAFHATWEPEPYHAQCLGLFLATAIKIESESCMKFQFSWSERTLFLSVLHDPLHRMICHLYILFDQGIRNKRENSVAGDPHGKSAVFPDPSSSSNFICTDVIIMCGNRMQGFSQDKLSYLEKRAIQSVDCSCTSVIPTSTICRHSSNSKPSSYEHLQTGDFTNSRTGTNSKLAILLNHINFDARESRNFLWSIDLASALLLALPAVFRLYLLFACKCRSTVFVFFFDYLEKTM